MIFDGKEVGQDSNLWLVATNNPEPEPVSTPAVIISYYGWHGKACAGAGIAL